jgi:FlaA1/EpsC-like NDP-sugar epimerase
MDELTLEGRTRIQRLLHHAAVLVSRRAWLLAVVHTLLFAAILWVAFWVRFDFNARAATRVDFKQILPWVLVIKLLVFAMTGQFHGWWRFITFSDLVALARACLFCFVALAVANFFLFQTTAGAPRSVVLLDTVFTLLILGSLRSTWRLFRECVHPALNAGAYRPAVLVGTDDEAVHLAHQIHSYGRVPYRVRGLVAADGGQRSGSVGNLPILGGFAELTQIAAAYGVKDVLVTAGRLPGKLLRELMHTCSQEGLELKIVPPMDDRLIGGNQVPIRDINIEDLLRREPVQLDDAAIGHLLKGRRVLVTGAGGSIGSEICRQVMRFAPDWLILVGRGENRIFVIERELQQTALVADPQSETANAQSTAIVPVIADIRDEQRMRQVFDKYKPEVVFHAAAHKHVPLMEANVGEAIRNNVMGTRCVADLAHEFGCSHFVMISSDKAVRPSSIMGATKQMAEWYVHALASSSNTRFMAVRFGNVLGSAGSVVPIFQEQIRQGGPITLTDVRMERYFMTIPEASQLVLQAAAMGKGGEVFLLEMGEPVKIIDLARDMIHLAGLPEDSIEITYAGIRPGEKLFEELALDRAQMMETEHPKVWSIHQPAFDLEEVTTQFDSLMAASYGKNSELRKIVRALVASCSAYHDLNATDGSLNSEVQRTLLASAITSTPHLR